MLCQSTHGIHYELYFGAEHCFSTNRRNERKNEPVMKWPSFNASGGWTRSAKHAGASCRFLVSCNKPSCCADLKE